MRRPCSNAIVAVLLGSSLLLAACSDDEDPDPVGTRCSNACAIDATHHCSSWTFIDPGTGKSYSAKDYCLEKCRLEAGEAERKYRKGCGSCVADGYQYSTKTDSYCQQGKPDVTCCYGPFSTEKVDSKKCGPICLEPDGGGI
jgi:hypothetical protein